MSTYKAVKPIGRFMPGDYVGGLTAEQISRALKDGSIVLADSPAPKEPKETKVNKGATNE